MGTESVEVLRERLSNMKRLMADRHGSGSGGGGGIMGGGRAPSSEEMWMRPPPRNPGIIDGNFLSVALVGALITILTVAVYAFYSLYVAVLKKFPSKHTEL